jgi:hypothetical protein
VKLTIKKKETGKKRSGDDQLATELGAWTRVAALTAERLGKRPWRFGR